MAQQNKTTKVGPRREALEASLIAQNENENIIGIETGRRHVKENSGFQRRASRQTKALRISQGLRYRHPNQVLNTFKGVTSTSSESSSLWEKSLVDQSKRVNMPKEFKVQGDSDGMVNQMGIVSVALDNYKASKQKFSRLHLVNV
jgi:hypothetical protein